MTQGALFTATEIRPRRGHRSRARPRKTIQIPTGTSRLIESSTVRRTRARSEALAAFSEVIARAARARLELLANRDLVDAISCPWSRIYDGDPCPADCRCGGTGTVQVGFLVAHYEQIVVEFGGAS